MFEYERFKAQKIKFRTAEPVGRIIFRRKKTMFEKIADIIAKQLRSDSEEITEDTNIMEDLGADSLDVVEILMAIEENFGVSVSDDEIPNLKTVRDLVEYVESNM